MSTGKDTTGQVSVPTLTGITLEEAKSLIEDSGLSLGNVTEVYNDDANLTGKVCKQSVDPETMVDSGTKIDLEVSKGVSATYYYSGEIEAPTAEEDPNYVAGTPVQVTITGNDGTMISILPSMISRTLWPIHTSRQVRRPYSSRGMIRHRRQRRRMNREIQ